MQPQFVVVHCINVSIIFCYLSLFKPLAAIVFEYLSILINKEFLNTKLIISSGESGVKYVCDAFHIDFLAY